MDILLGDILAQELLDQHRDVCHRLFGDLLQLSSGDDLALFLGLSRGDLGHDGQNNARVAHDCQAVDSADLISGGVEHAVVFAPLHVSVRQLLLDRTGHLLSLHDVINLGEVRGFRPGYISRDPDQASQVAEHEGEMSLSARTPLGLSHDLCHCILSEVGDLSVSHDLLSHEPD